MSTTTLAATGPRTSAIAAKAKPAKIAPHLLPNKAGQVGVVGVKSGIVNSAMGRKR
jgi:hypothetical protein